MMPRMSRRVDDVQKEFAEDFTVVNGNLLLCKVGYNSINLQIFSSVEIYVPALIYSLEYM